MEDCQEALEKLEHPEFDPTLLKIGSGMLLDATNTLRDIIMKIMTRADDIKTCFVKMHDKRKTYEQLKECECNMKEVGHKRNFAGV